MPYQVQQIIEGKNKPVCTNREESVSEALKKMIEHDYSQLPVIREVNGKTIAEGLITYEAIVRGIRMFQLNIENLHVRDVMVNSQKFRLDDDLFDILDRLKDLSAVLVTSEDGSELIGIVTSYDATEFFRNRTEDLMRVEDIEMMIKDLIKSAYIELDGEVNSTRLDAAISRVTRVGRPVDDELAKKKEFDDLTLSEFISLLLLKETWPIFEPIFGIQREAVNRALNDAREIRNELAHFRSNISKEQRDTLRFVADWLAKCQAELVASTTPESIEIPLSPAQVTSSGQSVDFSVIETADNGGSYSLLADWLQSQPGSVGELVITFDQIEEIIGKNLPSSARNHRAWWANDALAHSHSQLWIEAGWRSTYVNFSEGKVRFSRIRDREKAYIDFFSQLLRDLRKQKTIPVREVSPDGASWIVIHTIPSQGPAYGTFAFSFSRRKRMRVELYLDLGDQAKTKEVFDRLYAQKEEIESRTGEIEWERLDTKRASRLAMYHSGDIAEPDSHSELRQWAVETMKKLLVSVQEKAEEAIKKTNSHPRH